MHVCPETVHWTVCCPCFIFCWRPDRLHFSVPLYAGWTIGFGGTFGHWPFPLLSCPFGGPFWAGQEMGDHARGGGRWPEASPLGSLPVLLTLPRLIATYPLQFTYWFFSHLTYFIYQRLCRAAFSSSLFGFFSYGGNSLSLSPPPPLSSIVCRLGREFPPLPPPPFMPAPVLFPHSAIAREGNSPNTTATKIFIRYLLSCVWWIVALSTLCRRLHPFRCRDAFKGRGKKSRRGGCDAMSSFLLLRRNPFELTRGKERRDWI